MLTEQHSVAEDIAAHIADADHGEILSLGIEIELAEVPLDRLPGSPSSDAHRLVVVSD